MQAATKEYLAQFEELCDRRMQEIRNAKDIDPRDIAGITYYVSNDGNDANDGRTPQTAWQTVTKVNEAVLRPGDCVRFRRGDLFRGVRVDCKAGVTYTAYGEGEKPRFYGWKKSLAIAEDWTLYDEEHNIWRYNYLIPDCGTLVFNGGEKVSRKLIPSYIRGRFMCREDESKIFRMENEMTEDLDIFCYFTGNQNEAPSKGESFPVPNMYHGTDGDLFLRCDKGNPGSVFQDIEAIPRTSAFNAGGNPCVHIDNICMKYMNFGIGGGGAYVIGLHITNCEIGWIGGCIQGYTGTDPNYPEGTRGSVTRFGNGIEIYGGCDDFVVSNCYVYQVFDAGMSHQVSTGKKKFVMRNIKYADNLIEKCVYGIEYFLDVNPGGEESYMQNLQMSGNIIFDSGYGWGQQRHNKHTPAHIKGWSYVNTASDYRIHDNVFGRAGFRMVHLVAKEPESCPKMWNNTYIQDLGMTLGQYGYNREEEPENMVFDEQAEEKIRTVFGEENPTVYYIK